MIFYQALNPYTTSLLQFFTPLRCVSSKISTKILPSQSRQPEENIDQLVQQRIETLEEKYNVQFESGWVYTHDNAKLKSFEAASLMMRDKPLHEQRYIIKFMGNWGLIQEERNMNDLAKDAQALQANMVAFNYRGVGQSELNPVVYQDLITDGIAQVQRILDKGIDSKHILLDGRSLGGSIATVVAAHFHTRGLPVYLWNDRSFSSLTKAVSGRFLPQEGCTKELGEYLTSGILYANGWSVNAAYLYQTIPVAYKGYMYIAEQSEHSRGDGTIAHHASLHRGVAAFEEQEGIQTGHEFLPSMTHEFEGHTQPRSVLVSSQDSRVNAEAVFYQFFESRLRPVEELKQKSTI